jgi:hypothetical protein
MFARRVSGTLLSTICSSDFRKGQSRRAVQRIAEQSRPATVAETSPASAATWYPWCSIHNSSVVDSFRSPNSRGTCFPPVCVLDKLRPHLGQLARFSIRRARWVEPSELQPCLPKIGGNTPSAISCEPESQSRVVPSWLGPNECPLAASVSKSRNSPQNCRLILGQRTSGLVL